MSGYPHTLRPELHKALEAEGIDYWLADGITFWNRDDGCECLAYGYKADGVPKLAIKVVGFTDPAQVIAATLGQGTCHDKGYVYCSERYFVCSSCGCEFDYSNFACEFAEHRSLGNPHYCPNCGAKVVSDG